MKNHGYYFEEVKHTKKEDENVANFIDVENYCDVRKRQHERMAIYKKVIEIMK